MNYTSEELDNLRRLLVSPNRDNVEIALSIIEQESELLLYFRRYLAVIRCFNMNNKLYVAIQKAFLKHYKKNEIEALYVPIRLFGKYLKSYDVAYFQHLLPHIQDYVKQGQEYDGIIAQNEHYVHSFYKIGYACHHTYQQYEWAKYFYEKAIKYNPDKGLYQFYYAYLLQNKFLKKAPKTYLSTVIKYYKKTIALNYSLDYAYSNLAIAYDLTGHDYKKAEHYYLKSIEVNNKRATPYNNLGYLYFKTKRYDEAKPLLEKALALKPHYHHALSSMGELYMKAYHDYEKAKDYLERAIYNKPNDVFHRNLMGDLYLDHFNNKEKARYQYEKVLQFEPKNKHALKRLSETK